MPMFGRGGSRAELSEKGLCELEDVSCEVLRSESV